MSSLFISQISRMIVWVLALVWLPERGRRLRALSDYIDSIAFVIAAIVLLGFLAVVVVVVYPQYAIALPILGLALFALSKRSGRLAVGFLLLVGGIMLAASNLGTLEETRNPAASEFARVVREGMPQVDELMMFGQLGVIGGAVSAVAGIVLLGWGVFLSGSRSKPPG